MNIAVDCEIVNMLTISAMLELQHIALNNVFETYNKMYVIPKKDDKARTVMKAPDSYHKNHPDAPGKPEN